MKAEIYPDLSGRGDITQRRVQPYGMDENPTLALQAEIYWDLSRFNQDLSGRGDITPCKIYKLTCIYKYLTNFWKYLLQQKDCFRQLLLRIKNYMDNYTLIKC